MGYDDGFRMICAYLCVTAVGPELLAGAGGIMSRKGPAIGRSGKNVIVARVFAACLGFVLRNV